MSQGGRLGSGGGGGGVSSVAGGLYDDVVPVMNAVTAGSTVTLYNNTWSTPYVVDSRTTDGEKGTYSTIQDAIDAAVANGDAGLNTIAYIQIRGQGAAGPIYTENLNFPDNCAFFLEGMGSAVGIPFQAIKVAVQGNHTMVGSSYVAAKGIYFLADTGFAFSPVSQHNCFFEQCLLSFSANQGAVNLLNCNVTSAEVLDAPGVVAYNSSFSSVDLTAGAGYSFIDCSLASVVLNASAPINGYFTRCNIGTVTGTTGGSVSFSPKFIDCQMSNGVNVTGNVVFGGNSKNTGTSLSQFYTSTVQPAMNQQQRGNVRVVKKLDTSATLTVYDDYIGVTDTSSARTITLPISSGSDLLVDNQEFEIKDESGAAGTNNITIDGNGANIDGSPTLSINVNYGSVRLLWDGTEYHVL